MTNAVPTVKPVETLVQEEVLYPESDGEPMAETDTHRDNLMAVAEMLSDRYRDDPNVYISGNLFVYYEQGNPSAVFAPDTFVVFGVPKRRRRTYKLWEEGGKAPGVVFEMTLRKTWPEDEGNKKAVCQRLGVREYFLYDPYNEYLGAYLKGYRLQAGEYVQIPAEADGGLYSEVLDLYLHAETDEGAETLRLVDARTGAPLLTPREAYTAQREAEARAEAEAAARREIEAELARLRAEFERWQRENR